MPIASSSSPSSLRQLRPDAIVVGGGVIGVCCSYFPAKRGVQVVVLERQEIGQGASYGNAGVIAPSHAPINRPGRIRQAILSLADPLSPLYVAPRFNPALAVGPVAACPGLYIATGHAMQGLTLGPITDKLMAEYIVDGTPALDIQALRPDRF